MTAESDRPVSAIGEFALIQEICRLLPTSRPDVLIPPGDDAAVVAPATNLVLTTDVLVEGVDFDLRTTTPEAVGHKALAANLSDIAAMGAIPDHVLICWGAPGTTPVSTLLGIARGLGELARVYGVAVVGGDISASREIFIALTVTGHAPGRGAIDYHGARPGHGLYVTGTLGDSLAGYLLLNAMNASGADFLKDRHRRPTPRVREAQAILKHLPVTALTDISDGLSRDLHKLCRASAVGMRLDDEAIPLSAEILLAARILRRDPLDLALEGGEDFELLFTVDESAGRPDLAPVAADAGVRLTRIGECRAGEGVVRLHADGSEGPLALKGWEHFA